MQIHSRVIIKYFVPEGCIGFKEKYRGLQCYLKGMYLFRYEKITAYNQDTALESCKLNREMVVGIHINLS